MAAKYAHHLTRAIKLESAHPRVLLSPIVTTERGLVLHHHFCFQDEIKYFLDTLIQKTIFLIMKINT